MTQANESFLISFEKNLFGMEKISEVEILLKKLNFLGLNFDPFQPEVSSECQQIMDDLGLVDLLNNPYVATSILLQLLDKAEEHLNKLKH